MTTETTETTEYYEAPPADLTDEEQQSRETFIAQYLRACFESSPEGRELIRDAEVSADRWLLKERRARAEG